MGTSRSPLDLERKLLKLAREIEERNRKGVEAAALAVKAATLAELGTATKGTMRLRGVGLRGAKLGVGFTVAGSKNATALVKARGPWHLIESNTKAHTIRARRRGKQVLSTPYGPRASVNHPGTRGKRPWAKGVEKVVPALPLVFQKGVVDALKSIF